MKNWMKSKRGKCVSSWKKLTFLCKTEKTVKNMDKQNVTENENEQYFLCLKVIDEIINRHE